MRRLLLLVVILLTIQLPALGHTTHSHTCNSSHGWVYDSSIWRHNAQVVPLSSGGYHRSVQGHWQWLSGDGLNKWVWQHNTQTAYCPD